MTSELTDAFHRLLAVRVAHGATPLEPVTTTADDVARALRDLDVEPSDEIVTWYSMVGRGTVVDMHYNAGLLEAVEWYGDLAAIAEDFEDQPEPFGIAVDWFPLGNRGLVIWARSSVGTRPVAWRSEVIDFERPAYTGGLAAVMHTWADRFESGYYTVRADGEPQTAHAAVDTPDELMAAHYL